MSFFFNDTATTEIYTLSLHDALPISIQVSGTSDRSEGTIECFYRTSGQLPEPPSGVGRCSTADRSDAGPHAPITAGLAIIQDKVEARIIQRRWPGLANGGRAEP